MDGMGLGHGRDMRLGLGTTQFVQGILAQDVVIELGAALGIE